MSTDQFLPFALAFVMFGLGMTLEVKDFRRILNYPRSAITGLGIQILIPPALAFLLAWLFVPSDAMKVGLVLIAACPGGATSNLISHLVKGNVALSILMTAFNSFIIFLSIPIIVSLALTAFLGTDTEISMNVWRTVQEIGLSVILPVVIGMMIRQWRPQFADKSELPMKYLMPAIMFAAFVVVLVFGDGKQAHVPDIERLLLPLLMALLLNVGGILIGFYLPKYLKVGFRARTTIGIEVGVQNSLLAVTIAKTQLHSQEMAEVAIAYGSITFFTTLGLSYLLSKTTRKPYQEA